MRRILAVTYDGVQALDLVGPASVFAAARGGRAYRVLYASTGGGPRRLSSNLVLNTIDLTRVRLYASDTLLVPGAEEGPLRSALADAVLLRWLRRAAARVQRVASVCSGAFLLASVGLLDGRRCTTHWRACERLELDHPRVRLDANAIYVRSGRIWTSAGVTTGIDMALAMVELDHGRMEVDRLARELVLYVRRPGFQSQFSAALVAQTASTAVLRLALEWARENLPLVTVERLAERAGVSVRTLHRVCRHDHRTTPAKLLDRLRVERGRLLLSTTRDPLKVVAVICGFGGATRMKRAFLREIGMSPQAYRQLHGLA